MTTSPAALPPLGPFRPFPLPPHSDEVLANGLRVVTVRTGAVPLAEIRLFVPMPAHAVDPATAEVLAALTARDCARRATAGIDEDPHREGSVVSVSWTGRRLAASASVPVDAVDWALGLLARCVTSPDITGEDCEQVAGMLAARAGDRHTHPLTAAHAALHAHLFPGSARHPDAAALQAVTAEHVVALHTSAVRPRGSHLVVVAPRDTRAAVDAFAGWPDTGPPPPASPPPWSVNGPAGVPRPGPAGHAQVMLAAPVPARTDPVFPALSIVNCLFGGYFSSRLMRRLREDGGFVYSVESTIDDSLPHTSVLVTYATDPATVSDSLRATGQELRALVSDPPDLREIDAAREHMTGITSIGQTSQSGLATALIGVLGSGLDPGWLSAFPALLREVTVEQVVECARRFYRPERFTGVVLGAPGAWGDAFLHG
ncbi:insulinase family protein [Streptomyces cellulosae]|uniref:Insulinase family protein n=2 Tax=Streptomyces TaxID=1883 RepID=A0ABU3JJN3_9ACTN|nr:putative Zn-dependent peptidase [Streptomyces thermodiastaticus]MDT6974391.1 insulinase family protein [Streptomyces thermocarboxydus]THC48516.1 insulinase family protein [Streptomyces sp. Akac8]WSB43250.1 insulinase family protein [Streptomyces cellulosae]UVT11499.1 insulinase family protein [Streptomyces thermocarboxydus]